MADPIANWLAKDLHIPRKINSFDKDFSNGVLFAEVLSKITPQTPTNPLSNKYRNRDNFKEKITNLKLLEGPLSALGIKLNQQFIESIANCEMGAALKLLTQIKTACQKSSNQTQGSPLKGMTSLPPITRTGSIKSAGMTFGGSLSGILTPKERVNLALTNKLEKYEMAKTLNDHKAQQKWEEQLSMYRSLKDEARRQHLDKIHKNMEYTQELDRQGWENWQKNQDKWKRDKEKEDAVIQYMTNKLKKAVSDEEENERRDQIEGFNEFELNAQKQGVELEHDPDHVKKVEKVETPLSTIIAKLKEKTDSAELARKERDKRKRKMQIDQLKAQYEIEARKDEEALVLKFKEISKKEMEINFQRWIHEQKKHILWLNRKVEDEKYQKENDEKRKTFAEQQTIKFEQINAQRVIEYEIQRKVQREINLQKREEKYSKHKDLASVMLNSILEIAELCQQQQQKNRNIQIEPQFWRDCCDLFIREPAIIGKRVRQIEDLQSNMKEQDQYQLAAIEEYTQNELFNYMNGLQNWRPIHRAEPTSVEYVQVPNTPLNNFILGKIVHAIIDLKFPRGAQGKPLDHLPGYLPLKIMSLGYVFSGRKTLAKFLQEKYGIMILDFNEIIKEAVELNIVPPEVDNDPKAKNKKAAKPPPTKKDEPIKPVNLELKEIGRKIVEFKEKGASIPDELCLEAIASKLKEIFPPYDENRVMEEVRVAKLKEEERIAEAEKQLEKELGKAKKGTKKKTATDSKETVSMQTNPSKQKSSMEADVNLAAVHPSLQKRPYYSKGWMLINYPATETQIRKLETALSGYIHEDELLNEEAERRKQRSAIIVRAPAKEYVEPKLIPSGIDATIVLDTPKEECLRRLLGRRMDPKTGIMYHLEDNPPPPNDVQLNERLIPVSDPDLNENRVIEKLTTYDKNKEAVYNWLKKFGFEDEKIENLQIFNGVGKIEEVQQIVEEHIKKLLWLKLNPLEKQLEIWEERKRQQQALQINLAAANDPKTKKKADPKDTKDPKDAKDPKNQKDNKASAKQSGKDVDKSKRSSQNNSQNDIIVENDSAKDTGTKQSAKDGTKETNPKESEPKTETQPFVSGGTVVTQQAGTVITEEEKKGPEGIVTKETERISLIEGRMNSGGPDEGQQETYRQSIENDIPPEMMSSVENFRLTPKVIDGLFRLWDLAQEKYLEATSAVFYGFKEQYSFIGSKFKEIQDRFLAILYKEDEKDALLLKFQDSYNRFYNDNPELMQEPQAIEEIKKKLEELNDKTWVVIEKKKNDSVYEMKSIMESGYIEDEIDFFTLNIQKLMQGEIDRYLRSIQIIHDFFVPMDYQITNNEDETIIELLPGNDEYWPPNEDSSDPNKFPRLEFLYNNAIRVVSGQEVEVPGKKMTKRPNHRSFDLLVRVETKFESLENTVDGQENEALATERSIIRYRLFMLKLFAQSKIRELRMMANALYSRLDDWIILSIKAENDVVYSSILQIKYFGNMIENREKMNQNVDLRHKDISKQWRYIHLDNLTHLKIPSYEIEMPHRFTVAQLVNFVNEMFCLADMRGAIDCQVLNHFLQRRMVQQNINKRMFADFFLKKSPKNIGYMINKLDIYSSKTVPFKLICTLITLCSSPIAYEIQLDDYRQHLQEVSENGYISKDAFLDTPSFFDYSESILQTDGNLKDFLQNQGITTYDRAILIKELLFHINKDFENDKLNVDEFLGMLARVDIPQVGSPQLSPVKSLEKTSEDTVREYKTYTYYLFN